MKIKWSGIGIVDGRGKINGSVASKNRGGAYLRTKVTPINRRTNAQQNVRSKFGFIAQLWRNMTEVQRKAWNAAVENYKHTDIFGDLKSPSGFNLFSKLNLPMINTTGGWNDIPPTPVEVPNAIIDNAGANLTGNAMGVSLADNALNTGGGILVIDATPSLSPGINFVKSQYRRIHHEVVADASQNQVFNIWNEYVAVFGTPTEGMKIFFRVYYIAPTGQQGVPAQASAIVIDEVITPGG